jgi:hypothetical protein
VKCHDVIFLFERSVAIRKTNPGFVNLRLKDRKIDFWNVEEINLQFRFNVAMWF